MKKIFVIFLTLWFTALSYAQQAIVPSTALDAYLGNSDATWAWEVRDEYRVGNTTAYSIFLVSQKWQGILWKHELIVFVPQEISHDGALLFITGGSISDGMPGFARPNSGESTRLASIAERNRAITAMLRQTPNQPLFGSLHEDALIAFTLNEFRKDGDYSWPLLFPMAKSAIRSMDVVQEFAQAFTGSVVTRFVISGASKRGWTTWLAGATNDPRIVAIAPMVIDILNMPATLADQQKDYNYSEEIADYVELEIPQALHSEFGNALVQMIDPFSYRQRLTMPKMIFMGANDPYWTIDAIKHSIYEMPGQNLLCYVANAGHNLGDGQKAFASLGAFFNLTLNNKLYPACSSTLSKNSGGISLEVKINNCQPERAVLWTAVSNSRDFRQSVWTDKEIEAGTEINLTIAPPQTGYKAFFVEFFCKDSQGYEYSFTTRAYVTDL